MSTINSRVIAGFEGRHKFRIDGCPERIGSGRGDIDVRTDAVVDRRLCPERLPVQVDFVLFLQPVEKFHSAFRFINRESSVEKSFDHEERRRQEIRFQRVHLLLSTVVRPAEADLLDADGCDQQGRDQSAQDCPSADLDFALKVHMSFRRLLFLGEHADPMAIARRSRSSACAPTLDFCGS
ncbi:MAG TPA: hypothetical protein VFP14_10355 [Novosphingobium sp.]|nr:hypothetical protein [Novosphingobium sp.]